MARSHRAGGQASSPRRAPRRSRRRLVDGPVGMVLLRVGRPPARLLEQGLVVSERRAGITEESAVAEPLVRRGAKTTATNMAATLERIEQALA